MKIEFDPVKDAINKDKHGLSLTHAGEFDFAAATVVIDERKDYGETRYRAFVRTEGVGYCLVFTVNDETLRPISYRRAHEKEMRRYDL